MKKFFLSAFLCGMLAMTGVFMTSCGDDDDDEDNQSGQSASATALEGTWTSDEIVLEGADNNYDDLTPEQAAQMEAFANSKMNDVIKGCVTLTFKGNKISGTVKEFTAEDIKEMMRGSVGDLIDVQGMEEFFGEGDDLVDAMGFDYGDDFDFPDDATFEVKDNKIVVTYTEDGKTTTDDMAYELKDGKLYITTEEDGQKTTIVFVKKSK